MSHKLAMTILGLGLVLGACSEKSSPHTESPAVSVKVQQAKAEDVPFYVHGVGYASSYKHVQIYSQVTGKIIKTYVKDGQSVSQGELLYEIDPRPYEAELRKAEADVEEIQAEVSYQEGLLGRYQRLVGDDIVSQDTFHKTESKLKELQAQLKEAQATKEKAQLELEYCYIHAPMDGILGISEYDEGNVITETSTPLIALNMLSPMHVKFTLSQNDLSVVRHYAEQAKQEGLTVEVQTLAGEKIQGVLNSLQNAVDTLSGTIELEARVENTDKLLWPGEYLEVVLNLKTIKQAVLVPQEALQINSKGQYVYIANAQHEVEVRPVEVGQRFGSDYVITKGVEAGDTIVTDGQLRLYPGAKVTY